VGKEDEVISGLYGGKRGPILICKGGGGTSKDISAWGIAGERDSLSSSIGRPWQELSRRAGEQKTSSLESIRKRLPRIFKTKSGDSSIRIKQA